MRTLPPAAETVATAPRTVSFAADLAAHGSRTAIITDEEELTYRDLATRVHSVAERLGTTRRLVLIAGANRIDPLVTYLAALAGGHVALLVPPAQAGAVSAAYDPDVVLEGAALTFRRGGTAHELHPDLALLMSTSGSTGSPKLVRLSHQNIEANAESIATYLGIRDTDRAATTLPMHYCYGLSVVHSHLLRGAGIILTELSVADDCFWDLLRRRRGTTFAGVPLTFELLDRVGFADMRLPHLRYVTQAGGRLAPDSVRRHAELGRSRGWDLFVMYGQTEATARMAYLPPDLAASHPHAIGRAIPGGSLMLDPCPGTPEIGELIYTGPNVMLGYAETPADLGLGRTITSLRTGDLARLTDAGLFEIVGRRSGFVKIGGLRIDLRHLESVLAECGWSAFCAGDDDALVVAVRRGLSVDADAVRLRVARQCGLPKHAIRVCPVDELPRLPSGKPDYQAVLSLAGGPEPRPAGLVELFAEILDRPDASEDSTFVGLGGDSLSYVEMSTRLEEMLGHVPPGWHATPIRDLAPKRRRIRTIETSVLLRALSIIFIVGTHAGLFGIQGGAHLLLAVAGFNFGRFQVTSDEGRRTVLRRRLTSIAWIAVPSMIWIAAVHLFTGQYTLANVALLNGFLGSPTWSSTWHFWFVEILVYILLGLTAFLAIPWTDRPARRLPFGLATTVLAAGLLTRFEVVELPAPHMLPALWIFALGWAAAKASNHWQRLLLTGVAVMAVPGFFDDPYRDGFILSGVLLLMWTTTVPCPAPLNRIAGVLASASLYIYLTHWQIYPLPAEPSVALPASLGVGIAAWLIVTRATRLARAATRKIRVQTLG